MRFKCLIFIAILVYSNWPYFKRTNSLSHDGCLNDSYLATITNLKVNSTISHHFIVSAMSTAINFLNRAILKSKSVRTESNPISDETLALIKEKRRLRRQYSQIKDPAVKTCINQLQKQVKEDLRVETQASWEKFCNSISLEADSNESWRKIKNFLKPKGQRDYPTLHHATKVAKTNGDKAQLFAESVERHLA